MSEHAVQTGALDARPVQLLVLLGRASDMWHRNVSRVFRVARVLPSLNQRIIRARLPLMLPPNVRVTVDGGGMQW